MTLYEKIAKYDNSTLNALYYVNKSISFNKMLSNIRKLMTYFNEKGIRKGDVVTVVLPNIPTAVYTFYALNAIGAIQNIVHPLTSFEKVIETMKETNSKGVILLATNYGENEKIINESDYKFFFVNPMYNNSFLLRKAFYFKFKKPKVNDHVYLLDKFYNSKECSFFVSKDEKETSIYLHSGGTTGTPKVICLSDYAINNLVDKIDGIVECNIEGKSMLAVLPMFHGFGLGMGVHGPLSKGAASAIMMKFDADKVVDWINQNKVNMIIGVPVLYQKLMRNKKFLSSKLCNLEFCFVGGDNVPPSLILEFNEMMKNNNSGCMMLEGYGLTETVTVCNVNTKSNFKIGSVGKPLEGVEIKIFSEEFNELKCNEIGEVFINSNTFMNGYLFDEKTTNETLINFNNVNYVKTGDLGYLDEDGFLFLKGRKKRMFKISGLNVYPSEIEKIVSDSEDIIDASLEYFIEPKPHLVLYVIKNRNSKKNNEEIENQIMEELKNKVLKYSLPQKIIFMNEFPKTNVGKINHQGFKDPLNILIKDQNYTLYNGVKIPKIGFGTWQNKNKDECINSVVYALKNGYRHIDTAAAYGNEEYIKEAIKLSGIPRENIFITSKLMAELKGYEVCKKEFEKTLERLGTDYLDLYLIHAPNPWDIDQNSLENMDLNIDTWKMMEELYKDGKIRAIGVSNFNATQIEILKSKTTIVPMVNQDYCHVGEPRLELIDYCQKNNILFEAYSPLKVGRLIEHPELKVMAKKYNVSVAQLCIKFCLELGTLPLPKSVHEEYILSNLNVDFKLMKEDFEYLKKI